MLRQLHLADGRTLLDVFDVDLSGPAGVVAARAGGMASVGVARLGDEALLRAAKADLVVTSLDQVCLAELLRGTLKAMPVETAPAI